SVGGFLVYDVALRTQWKEKYFALVTEANAMKASKESTDGIIPKLINDYKKAVDEFEQAKLKLRDLEVDKAVKLAEHDAKVQDLNLINAEKTLTITQTKELAQRLTSEIDVLKVTIKDRETSIV